MSTFNTNALNKYQILLLVTVLAGLTSCSTSRIHQQNAYPTAGTKIVLHKSLSVLPDRAGLFIQNGENKGGNHNRFEPFCYIRFHNVSDEKRTIKADTFEVINSRIETRLIARNTKPLAPPYNNVSFRLVDSTPSDILEVLTMQIRSKSQPNIHLLECGGIENSPSEVEPPTPEDVKTAMGSIMTFQ